MLARFISLLFCEIVYHISGLVVHAMVLMHRVVVSGKNNSVLPVLLESFVRYTGTDKNRISWLLEKGKDLVVNGVTIKNVSQFKYSGSIIDSSGTCEKDNN
ncbi:hypothetical protein ANN_26763 [Periplaneta americana]|uniref:Uncharacterized protein n=1 Tax=Periplaneta americana TaxID=6978 RepID=A0ABQ8RZ95_PERAM|nr:hypothetical protein ANN_26763 [Periplaneta americana]